jgi:predicted enzyme related to lactoylglutathione lyase
MGRPVVHWEFWSEAPQELSEFYKKVLDWNVRSMPDLDYLLAETGAGGINGVMMKPKSGPWPAKLTFYVNVDDLDAHAAKIADAGGKMVVDKMDVPGVGQLSLFEDLDGRVIWMWKPFESAMEEDGDGDRRINVRSGRSLE